MKLLQSLWALTDNDAMDVTQIESTPITSPTDNTEPALTQQNIQNIVITQDYSNIINLLDYIKLKKHAY